MFKWTGSYSAGQQIAGHQEKPCLERETRTPRYPFSGGSSRDTLVCPRGRGGPRQPDGSPRLRALPAPPLLPPRPWGSPQGPEPQLWWVGLGVALGPCLWQASLRPPPLPRGCPQPPLWPFPEQSFLSGQQLSQEAHPSCLPPAPQLQDAGRRKRLTSHSQAAPHGTGGGARGKGCDRHCGNLEGARCHLG